MSEYNMYIDESCHLEHDKAPFMCIGYIRLDRTQQQTLSKKIKQLKLDYHTPTEIKWNKLSYSRLSFYKSLIDYFFESDMAFRAVLIKDKSIVDNTTFNENDHNIFHYKSAFYLLRFNIESTATYRVYFDIKDSKGKRRLQRLSSILDKVCGINKFSHFQDIRSHESEFIQLCDLFIGAIGYKTRHDINKTSKVKNELIDYIESKLGYSLDIGTSSCELKFNIFELKLRER
ncbi:MAG: DUF3800 domain-containing protein [Tannerellaceae bacterium]